MKLEKKPMEAKAEQALCPCKRKKCKRFGDCRGCRAHHGEKGTPPYCERPAGKQRSVRTKTEGSPDE